MPPNQKFILAQIVNLNTNEYFVLQNPRKSQGHV